MPARFGITLPLWSFADDPALLERLAGEITLDHISTPAVTGPQLTFRIASATAAPHFHTEGGWHFPTSAKLYAPTGLKPPRARWFAATDHLARLRDAAARLGLDLVARIDLRAVLALIEAEPHLAQRNAWGQDLPPAGPCVCNPHARELLRATLEDLRRYEPTAFELVNWNPGPAPTARQASYSSTLASIPDARPLLESCFCPACRQIAESAGVDPDLVARHVRELLPLLVRRAAADTCPATPAGQPNPTETTVLQHLAAYDEARMADLARWRRRLADSDPQHTYWHLQTALPAVMRRHADLPHILDCAAAGVSHASPPPPSAGLAVPCWRPFFPDSAALVRFVAAARENGCEFFDFECVDESPPDASTWLKQAVRFARRG